MLSNIAKALVELVALGLCMLAIYSLYLAR
jgi:hypothetical protein